MTLVLKPGYGFDSDASTYIDAVETADGQALETGVRIAINDFVLGCKQDEIWDAIKASCILAGARTLDGALVPLVKQPADSAPARFGTEGGWNYNRETGLQGNGQNNYINSGRNNNADPQNSKHLAVYFGAALSIQSVFRAHIGVLSQNLSQTGASIIGTDTAVANSRYRINGSTPAVVASGLAVGLKAASRSVSGEIVSRQNGTSATTASTSETPANNDLYLFARNITGPGGSIDSYSDARLSFYSIGESLDLAKLDTRVSNLITAIGAAIP